jgi:signal transduction histidine kinase
MPIGMALISEIIFDLLASSMLILSGSITGLIIFLLLLFIVLRKKRIEISNYCMQLDQNKQVLGEKNKIIEQLTEQTSELQDIIALQKVEISESQKEYHDLKNHIHETVLRRTSELSTALEKSAESNRIKEVFLEKISREIRTPLNSILGFINLLNDPNLSKIDREYFLKFIRESGNNLLVLIDNIVDFTRLETSELVIEYKPCNLNLLLGDLVDKYRNRILREKPDLTIIFNKAENNGDSLSDCKRIVHVLDQLINNAIKFTSVGKIEINYQIKDGSHEFKIFDTGIGIDKKYHDVIFERFYQIETESRDIFQGAGLGLTIAKGITEILGGKLFLESELGKGSCFVLTVPYREIKSGLYTKTNIETHFEWQNKTILIAEDEDSNYFFLEAVLKKTKAKVLRAVDGVKFLEIMNENKNIDLVLLDIKMPGINGFNAIKVVRQQSISIPVIAQTAFNQPEDKQRCLDSGCNDYLSKPIDKELLLNKIARFFNN